MVNRIRIGQSTALGDTGIFISKPGRDVDDPTTNLLLDSRYRSLTRHVNGRVNATKVGSGSIQTWWAEVTFPDLGYVPIFYASFVYDHATDYGLPDNGALIPTNAATNFGPSGGNSLDNSGAWIVGTNVLRAGLLSQGNATFNLQFDLVYIIFKNRFGE
jgi:hypothetical protein